MASPLTPALPVLMATWRDGLFLVSHSSVRQELPGQSVCGLKRDARGGTFAIVNGRTLCRRLAEGRWQTIAKSPVDLACCVEIGEAIYAGTEDARIFRIDANGSLAPLQGFDAVPGRETWYAGSALVNGHVVGPPLGIRSMTATCDGAALLANVHVGGIPRSIDAGQSWQPTIDVDTDVHEVRAHPTQPAWVAAAAAVGLCISRDAGATWTIERDGLHAAYCSAVAFAGDDILVAASTDHFATEGAVYRRSITESGPLRPVEGGLPRRISGICDTGCIDTQGSAIALADRAGNVYLSADSGHRWSCCATGHRDPIGLAIL